MKSPHEIFLERCHLFIDPVEVADFVLAVTQPLYNEIEKLKSDALEKIESLEDDAETQEVLLSDLRNKNNDLTRLVELDTERIVGGSVVTDDLVPGSLKGVYKGAGK